MLERGRRVSRPTPVGCSNTFGRSKGDSKQEELLRQAYSSTVPPIMTSQMWGEGEIDVQVPRRTGEKDSQNPV